MLKPFVLSLLVLLFAVPAQAAQPYQTSGSCDGFPKVDLNSLPGTCVGLVASGLGFPRGMIVSGSDVYVADMGGWVPKPGRLLRLPNFGGGKPEVLLTGLNQPTALALAPDGTIYVGQRGRISRLDMSGTPRLIDVLTGLPVTGRHPIPALAVAADGSLYVNIGSATNNCETAGDGLPNPNAPCPETEGAVPRGSIIHFMPVPGKTLTLQDATVVARGLRNSMALVVLADGRLAAAVNARDYIHRADPSLTDAQFPHDTLDIVQQGGDYGWPYCFDDNRPSPEYPHYDCASKLQPNILLPPHAAPLSLLLYRGTAIPPLWNTLVIPYHGYEPLGHEITAMTLDSTGAPAGKSERVIWGWDAAPGSHPQGAPVAVAELPDGTLLITEDKNGTLLRLAPDNGH